MNTELIQWKMEHEDLKKVKIMFMTYDDIFRFDIDISIIITKDVVNLSVLPLSAILKVEEIMIYYLSYYGRSKNIPRFLNAFRHNYQTYKKENKGYKIRLYNDPREYESNVIVPISYHFNNKLEEFSDVAILDILFITNLWYTFRKNYTSHLNKPKEYYRKKYKEEC